VGEEEENECWESDPESREIDYPEDECLTANAGGGGGIHNFCHACGDRGGMQRWTVIHCCPHGYYDQAQVDAYTEEREVRCDHAGVQVTMNCRRCFTEREVLHSQKNARLSRMLPATIHYLMRNHFVDKNIIKYHIDHRLPQPKTCCNVCDPIGLRLVCDYCL